jgi:hypothetical protein
MNMCTPEFPDGRTVLIVSNDVSSVIGHLVLERMYSSRLSQILLARKNCHLYILLQIQVLALVLQRRFGPVSGLDGQKRQHQTMDSNTSISHLKTINRSVHQ